MSTIFIKCIPIKVLIREILFSVNLPTSAVKRCFDIALMTQLESAPLFGFIISLKKVDIIECRRWFPLQRQNKAEEPL